MNKSTKLTTSARTSARRRKHLKESHNTLLPSQAELVRKDFNYECALTGKTDNIVLDHFIPISWGTVVNKYRIGGNTYANMLPINRSINSSKRSHPPFFWCEKYGERHEIPIEKWNYAVQYIAEKHGMDLLEYQSRVTACVNEMLAIRWINHLHARLEKERMFRIADIDTGLKMNLNMSTVVAMFGNKRLKELFMNKGLINIVNERKILFESRLKYRS